MTTTHLLSLSLSLSIGSVSLENPEGDSEDIHLVVTDTLEVVEDLGLKKLI